MFLLCFSLLLAYSVEQCSAVVNGLSIDMDDFKFLVRVEVRVYTSEDFQGDYSPTVTNNVISGIIVGSRSVLTLSVFPKDTKLIKSISAFYGSKHRYDALELRSDKDHEIYTRTDAPNLAIVRFKSSFIMDKPHYQVAIATYQEATECELADYAGWGLTRESADTHEAVEGHGYVKYNCTANAEYCLMPPNSKMGPCTGDVGSPIVVDNEVIGILTSVIKNKNTTGSLPEYMYCEGSIGVFISSKDFRYLVSKYAE